jgi:hypothetical protein
MMPTSATYFEKVIDTRLRFAPTPQEAAGVTLDSQQPGTPTIARCCALLGIANIRLIKKIERAVQQVTPLLGAFHPKIAEQARQSIALFAWSIYEPQRAPTPELLNERSIYIVKEKRDQIGAREAESPSLMPMDSSPDYVMGTSTPQTSANTRQTSTRILSTVRLKHPWIKPGRCIANLSTTTKTKHSMRSIGSY